MPYYKGEHNKLAKVCNQVLKLIHIHPHMLSQDSQLNFLLSLVVWLSAALSHLKRGTAADRPRHYHDLSDR